MLTKVRRGKKFCIRSHQSWGILKEYCFPRTLFNFGKVANAFLIRTQEAKVFKTDWYLCRRSLKQTLRLQKRRIGGENEKWESFSLWKGNQFLQKKKIMNPQHSWPQQLIGLIAIYHFFPIFISIIVQLFWRKVMQRLFFGAKSTLVT